MNTSLQETVYNPNHSISVLQLQERQNILIISDQGMGFRQQLLDDQKMEKFIQKQNSIKIDSLSSILNAQMQLSESESQVSLSKINSKAQMSLLGAKSQIKLLAEIKKDVPIELIKLPYINTQIEKITNQIIIGRNSKEKSVTAINNRMYDLQSQLSIVNDILAKRSSSQRTQPVTSISTVIEEDELQDKVAAIANLEARIERIGARYMKGKIVQDQIQKVLEMENININSNQI